MLKKLLSIILAFSLVLGIVPMALADSQIKPTIKLNGINVELKDEVYLNEQGKIMLPLREIIESLGYEVKWEAKDQSVTILNETESIKLAVGDKNTIIKESKTFMPLQLLSDSMNLIIGLDNKNNIIKINQPKKNVEDFFQKSNDQKINNKLNDYMKALEKSENFSGTVLVAKDGKVLLNQAYGFADFNQNIENKSETTFAIGSITKQITAMGIMQLVEKDLIKVEDKISKYIPSAPHGDKITIHNLLTHTSGLKNYTSLSEFLTLDLKNKNQQDMMNLIKDLPLNFEPGEDFEYSNTNYLLLGMIIENITEKPLEDYLKENIFDPLNMKDTGISYGKDNETPDATPYTGYLEVQPIDDELILTQAYGAGNIYSTVEDLYRWDRSLYTEKLIKKETLNEMFKSHIDIGNNVGYGYGWMIEDTELGKVIYHGGNTFGFSSNIARYTDKDLTVIILTNKGGSILTELTNVLADIVLDKEYKLPEEIKEIEIKDPSIYNKYVGRYSFISGTYMDIIKKDDGLYAQVTGQSDFKIYPQTETKFFAKQVDVTMDFKVDENGEVNEFLFDQMGLEIVSKRVENEEENREVNIDPLIYDEYVGDYELAPGVIFNITKEDNKIYAQLTNQDKFEIFPKSENEFFYKVIDAQITFVKEDGKTIKLILHQNGQDMPAAKTK